MVAYAKDTPVKVNLKYVFGLLALLVIGFLILSVLSTKSGMSSGIRTTSNQGSSSSSGGSSVAQPAAPMGQNEQYQTVTGIQGTTKGLPSSCNSQPLLNADQLLPKDNNTQFQQLNPQGGGPLENISLLQAGYHNGIDTIGSSLRNSNLQVRSEPPNPTSKVSPWMNSTIEPDLMRTPLELGCGTQ
jgi:hypothetical protein